jgi:hypothetical protein
VRALNSGDNHTNAPAGGSPSLRAAFLSNDEISDRIVVVEVRDLTADAGVWEHLRQQCIAVAFCTHPELLGSYVGLAGIGTHMRVDRAARGFCTPHIQRAPFSDENSTPLGGISLPLCVVCNTMFQNGILVGEYDIA